MFDVGSNPLSKNLDKLVNFDLSENVRQEYNEPGAVKKKLGGEDEKGRVLIAADIEKRRTQTRPCIVLSIECILGWGTGFSICLGSTHFDNNGPERLKNSIIRFIKKSNAAFNSEHCFRSHDNFDEVIEIESKIRMLQHQAITALQTGKYREALLRYERIKLIYRDYDKNPIMATIEHNIGIIQILNDNLDKGREALSEAFQILKVAQNAPFEQILGTLILICLCDYASNNVYSAEYKLKECLSKWIVNAKGYFVPKLSEIYHLFGCIYYERRCNDIALQLFAKSFEIQITYMRSLPFKRYHCQTSQMREQQFRHMTMSTTVLNIGIIQMHMKQYERAIVALEDTFMNLSLILDRGDSLMMACMDNLAISIIANNDDLEKALKVYQMILHVLEHKYGPYDIMCSLILSKIRYVHASHGHYKRACKCIRIIQNNFKRCVFNEKSLMYDQYKKLVDEEIMLKSKYMSILEETRKQSDSTLISI